MRFRRTDKTTRTLFFHIFSSSSFHKNVCASILLSLSFLLLHQIYLWRRISFPAGWSGGGSCCHSVIISSHSAECRILFFRSNRQPGFVKNRWQIAKLYGKENFFRHDGIVNEEFIARPQSSMFLVDADLRLCGNVATRRRLLIPRSTKRKRDRPCFDCTGKRSTFSSYSKAPEHKTQHTVKEGSNNSKMPGYLWLFFLSILPSFFSS